MNFHLDELASNMFLLLFIGGKVASSQIKVVVFKDGVLLKDTLLHSGACLVVHTVAVDKHYVVLCRGLEVCAEVDYEGLASCVEGEAIVIRVIPAARISPAAGEGHHRGIISPRITGYYQTLVVACDKGIFVCGRRGGGKALILEEDDSGGAPAVHGIRKYEKPIIKIDTLFDAMIRDGKRCAIVADKGCSIAHIFLERKMDYYLFDTIPEINAKAAELILEDRYDLICVYNGNYDSVMHKTGPESVEALSEMRANCYAFAEFCELIKNNWDHNALIGFAMDHGCHEIDGGCGSHGLDMDEDLHIVHLYGSRVR